MKRQVASFVTDTGDLLTVTVEALPDGKTAIIQTLDGEVIVDIEHLEDLRAGIEQAILVEPEVRCQTLQDEIRNVEQSLENLKAIRDAAEAVGSDQAMAKAEELARRIAWRELRLERLRQA